MTVRVALLFPGQGVQREGMGEPWRDCESWPLVERVSEWTGVDVEELLLRTDGEALRRTDLAQIAVFTTGMLAFREARRAGALDGVAACAGHSLGEYAALVAAGALSLRDGAQLVAARGRAMRACAERSPGTMAVVLGGDAEAVEAIVAEAAASAGPVWAANFNSRDQVVVSGRAAGVAAAVGLATERGLKAIDLPVSGAFHTPLMAPAAESLRRALAAAAFAPRHLAVVANVDARPHAGKSDWRDLLVRQLTGPVRWEQSLHTLTRTLDCRRLVELGTGRTLAGIARRNGSAPEVVSAESPDALHRLTTDLERTAPTR